jgi:HAD superfamily hydrolase (TIGR01549 family)
MKLCGALQHRSVPILGASRRTNAPGAMCHRNYSESQPPRLNRGPERIEAIRPGSTSHNVYAAMDTPSSEREIPSVPLVYEGIIFDMDGTLSVSCIDYAFMRSSLDIPEGDLFTVIETWDDGDRILSSMDTILEIEDVAAKQTQGMPGVTELLSFLERQDVKVGLVTRNTEYSVDMFFQAIGEHHRGVFDIVMTREFHYVKPDKRCLLHFSRKWNIPASRLLMVGDSTEDVECGNAAGTASCLISGGGNEVNAEKTRPLVGTVPSFTVDSLDELRERLEQRDTPLGWEEISDEERLKRAQAIGGDADSGAVSGEEYEVALDSGMPFNGLDFFNYLFDSGAIDPPACSFPRLRSTIIKSKVDDLHPGMKVLHLGCGDGGLTKMLFSAGLNVCGADSDTQKAQKRGLATVDVDDYTRVSHAIKDQLNTSIFPEEGGFDALVFFQDENNAALASRLFESGDHSRKTLEALAPLMKRNGKFVIQVDGMLTSEVRESAAWEILSSEVDQTRGVSRCIMKVKDN